MERMSKQLILSGKLKPEVRLGIEISNFAQSLDDERREEFRRMQTAKGIHLSGWDVIKVTEEINQEGSRRHRAWKTHGTKVGGFLSRIQTLVSIGDVLIGGSQNLIATGVWSALRLSLTIATNYMGYFEKLSTLFMRLGTSWALHEDFAQLFPRSEILQTYFCEYLITLMKLCNKVVVFGQKNTSAQLFSSLGSSFDSEFGTIQKELDQWGCLIQQQCQILAMKIATGAENSRSHDVKQRILRRLSPYQKDLETRWRRQRKKGTCEWIFDNPSFKDWKSMQNSATLCICGKLGSGKTVSMANIVARTDLKQPCAYAFCAFQEPTSLKATNILGSIAFSLLDHLPPEAVVWGNAEQFDAMINTFDPESIINFVLGLLPVDRTYIIIVDGLEDCSGVDVNDVISGLHRLKQNRIVLLCYSSRSDSLFQHVAKQYLTPEFLISHDDFNHDAELESYIVKEVTRRNASRHLSPDLEELVKKQLIIGAQGMYLWASLQLDTIFPASSDMVITDDHILNLITHLPKDLPEAFERALEGITDRQYEGRIMSLVMAAVTPLDLNEIRVALCVVPGELVWHPEKAARDGTQLISLCGGNLIDLDEEDDKVRFIHHSVIQHLLSPATSQGTTLYHFTAEDAENFMGATCVTYLHLSIPDSRLAMTRNLQGVGMSEMVIGATQQSLPVVSHLVQHIRAREHRRARPSHIDMGHVLSQIQAARIQQNLDPRCFRNYATSNWVFHTRFFEKEIQGCKETWDLWWQLLHGRVATVKPPFADLRGELFTALSWAVEHAHGSLFRNVLAECVLLRSQVAEIMSALELHKSIHGRWLGDFLAQFVQSLYTLDTPLTSNRITLLLDLGADPAAQHSMLKTEPIKILASRICTDTLSDDDQKHIIRAFLAHPAVRTSFGDKEVATGLGRILESDKTVAIAEILACRPALKMDYHRIPARELITESAIERALDRREWEEVEELATQGCVNTPTFAGTSLLWRAIETMSDQWVYHLLHLGADPEIGPFEMMLNIDSPNFVAKCYPLEAALWLRRTPVCLELLRHEAHVGRLGDSPIRIARETGNWILIAKLNEIQEHRGRQGPTSHRRHRQQRRTALATACKMFSQNSSSEPLGFPRPLHLSNRTISWEMALDKIIVRLALDENAEYVNAQDEDEKTALLYLTEAKNMEPYRLERLVNVLLNRGADPNLADCHGNTPLRLAISNSTPIDSMTLPLLKAGVDSSAPHPLYGGSRIQEAMVTHDGTNQEVRRLVRLLLEAGADPRDPWTPKSPDSSLISAAMAKGIEFLVSDLEEYVYKWSRRGIEGNLISNEENEVSSGIV